MKKRSFYIGLNLIAPGIGQCAMGWWIRGLMELLAALACFFGCLWELILPIALSVRNLLEGDGEILKPDLLRIGLYIGTMALVWLWSFIEICLFAKDPPPGNS